MTNAAGQPLEEPHVRARRCQLNVAQALAANLRKCYFHAAFIADHAAVLHALVFAAQALPVGYRTENLRAKKPVALRLERPVVDGLGLGYLPVGPRPDLLR